MIGVRPVRTGLAVMALAAATLSACSSDGDDRWCVGAEDGEVSLSPGVDNPLPGGGSAGIASLRLDDDPPAVNLSLGDATEAERQAAVDMQVGDTFELQGTSYELVGACEDRDQVWLDPATD